MPKPVLSTWGNRYVSRPPADPATTRPPEHWITLPDARRLGISEREVYRLVEDGTFPTIQHVTLTSGNKETHVPLSAVNAYRRALLAREEQIGGDWRKRVPR